jgi:hypothetical protein
MSFAGHQRPDLGGCHRLLASPAKVVETRKVLVALVAVAVVVIAVPILGLREGSSDPSGSTPHQA